MLKQTLSQKASLKLLPKIILNQNILGIPTLALDNIIKKEIEVNPMLEEGNENDHDENEQSQPYSELAGGTDESNSLSSDNPVEESIHEAESSADNPKEEFDWDEYFENETNDSQYDSSQLSKSEMSFVSDDGGSLKDNMLVQLHLAPLDDKLIFVGEEIIWSLNDEGYFTDQPDEIIEDLNSKKNGTQFADVLFDIDDLNEALSYIQNNIDPPGVAARNLKECLLIQIRRSSQSEEVKNLSNEIINNHLDDLKQRRYERISHELGIDLSKVKAIFEFIQKLNPKPGLSEGIPENNYIVPDLIVKKVGEKYEVFLNEKFVPSLRVNRAYKNLYYDKKKKLDKDTKEYIVSNFNRAKWFIEAINSRRETLIRIMEAILERQKEYFENNETGLKPMFEKDIAEDIKMDTSTISRAVRGKYVQTDFGIFELRSFFTTSLAMNDGGEDVSNTEAKNKLKELIENEDKSKPLTDEELSIAMKKLGYQIARRTVAKYREAINIPIAKLRRLLE